MRRRTSSQHLLLVALAASLVVSACGKDGDESAQGAQESTASADESAAESPEPKEGKGKTGDKSSPKKKADEEAKSPNEKPQKAEAPSAADGERAPKEAPAGEKAKKGGERPADTEGAEAEKSALLSPAERRKAERERRIAELKRRNEERRASRDKGEAAVNAAAPAERAAAPNESKEQAAAKAAEKPKGLNIARFLSLTEVRKITGKNTLQPGDRLVGQPPSQRYNSLYFTPADRTAFGLSFQFHKEETRRDANERFRLMRQQYPNAEDASAPTAKSFYSLWDDILSLTFADLSKRVVITLSCSKEICSPENLLDLAKLIQGKL